MDSGETDVETAVDALAVSLEPLPVVLLFLGQHLMMREKLAVTTTEEKEMKKSLQHYLELALCQLLHALAALHDKRGVLFQAVDHFEPHLHMQTNT